jgi:F-type H+-transporting ATPase subunit epsilon
MTFSVQILALDRVIFEGKAIALSVPGQEGELQVLAEHAPLISLLTEGDMVIQKEDGTSQTIPVAGGVLKVNPEEVVALVSF